MNERKEYEMTEAQHSKLMDACKPTPAMTLSGGEPMFGTPQENANRAWKELGEELGFLYMTVPGKSDRFFSAIGAEQ